VNEEGNELFCRSGEGNMPGPIWALDFSDGREFTGKRDSSNFKRGFAVRS